MSDKLVLNLTIKGSTITSMTEYIKLILDNLNITDGGDPDIKKIRARIIQEFTKYDDNKLYEIRDRITPAQLDSLITADEEINKLIITGGVLYKYYSSGLIKENWDNTIKNLAKLQGLIILRKAVRNCSEAVKALTDALDTKLTAVNAIIESQIV